MGFKPIFISVCLIVFSLNYGECVLACPKMDDFVSGDSPPCYENPLSGMNAVEILQHMGYAVMEQKLITDDGYEVSLIRTHKQGITPTKPVLLCHGIIMNYLSLVNSGNKSLTASLVNADYDVWLISYRGTKPSLGHTYLKNDSSDYWSYNMDNIAAGEIRLSVKKILNTTSNKPLIVGFSMGCTVSTIYSITYASEAAANTIGLLCLAPPILLHDIESILYKFSSLWTVVRGTLQVITKCRVDPSVLVGKNSEETPTYLSILGKETTLGTCFGIDYKQIDPTYVTLAQKSNMDATSCNVIEQFCNIMKLKRFVTNGVTLFNLLIPPTYNLKLIKIPIAYITAVNDWLVSEKNAKAVYNQLPHQCGYDLVSNPDFTHSDYIKAKDAPQLVHELVLARVDKLFKSQCK